MAYKLRSYQAKMCDAIMEGFKKGRPFIAQAATACHAKGEKVLMYDGSIKNVEDVVLGDELMGPDSDKRVVVDLHRGRKQMVKIIPRNRWQPITVTIDHILSLQNSSRRGDTGRQIVNISVEDYLRSKKTFKHLYKLYRSGVEFKQSRQTIPPYILGLWLGDGTNAGPSITTPDIECAEAWVKYTRNRGVKIRVARKPNNKASTYFSTTNTTKGQKKSGRNPITEDLRALNLLNNKHIPKQYLIASREQRLQLFAGLLDSDGYMGRGAIDYITKYKQLAEDIRYLALSLGFGCRVSPSKKGYLRSDGTRFEGQYYRMSIGGDFSEVPTKLERKEQHNKPTNEYFRRSGFDLEYVGEQDYYGFEVTKDHLYLTDDFVVTHNSGKSLVIAEVAKRLGEPVLVLAPNKEIVEQNYAKMMAYGLPASMYSASVGKKEISDITIATIGSIFRKPEDFKHFKYCMFDECHGFSAKSKDGMYKDFFLKTGIRNVCGLTATPYRLEQKFFGDVYTGCTKMLNRIAKDSFFKDIVYKVEMKDLIEQGYVLQPKYHTYETDLSTLVTNTTGRDYTVDSLEKWGNQNIGKLLNMAEELDKKHQRVLVFCTSVAQAEKAKDALVDKGMSAAIITAKTPKKERNNLIEKFQSGEIKWMLNCQTMTTGFDCPPLDCIVLLRPTYSVSLLTQMVGRGVRLDPNNPKKEAHIYDFTNNIKKFGSVENIRLQKEDGWKDMLMGERGRIDNVALFTFDKKENRWYEGAPQPKQEALKIERPETIDTKYLMSLI